MEMNLVKLVEQFGSEDKCWQHLEQIRWPNGIQCPHCGSPKISRIQKRRQFDCDSCRYQFSATCGTIFHDTHLPLWKWFTAMYLMIESKKGMSANQMKRTLGISYKTAWYLCHRIRKAMSEMIKHDLSGTVEVDETWIGGKETLADRRRKTNKTIVIGAIERAGKIRLQVIKAANRKTLHAFIRKHTDPKTKRIMTDELAAYRGIADFDTDHETVNHSIKEYVRGDVHTNGIENVWSLLKRSIIGTYHKLSAKHLNAYLDELEWRFNNRENPYLFNDTLKKLIQSQNLEYKELVAS